MTKPNEPACPECSRLASRVEELEKLLAKHSNTSHFTDSAASNDAQTAPSEIREVLRKHWLFAVECNHEAKTDAAICACGWKGYEMSVGDAVDRWIDHVLIYRKYGIGARG